MTGRLPAAIQPDELAARVLARSSAAAATGAGPLVALDHDGVLAPIAPTPDAAAVPPATLAALSALSGRTVVAVVSGRGLEDLTLRLGRLPITLIAEHGLRARSPDGDVAMLAAGIDPAALARLRTELDRTLAGRAGWIVEDKGVGIAVHHRLAPTSDVVAVLPRIRSLLERTADAGGGRVQEGHEVLEVRSAGADKGAALRWLAARHPGRTIVMVGDDRTDEPALAAAEAAGGIGVLVATEPRPSAASVALADPVAVATLLGALADGIPVSRG